MRTGQTRAVPRALGLASQGTRTLLVDTYQGAPASMAAFSPMNPFHYEPSWRIPAPGLPGRFSRSVESVWQALKLINGQVDLGLLDQPPRKRPPDHQRGGDYDYAASRLLLGDHVVDLVTARLLIYLPTYLYLLDMLVPEPVLGQIGQALSDGRDVLFFDCDDNFDITDPSRSFSHSALLAAWFGGRLEPEFQRPYERLLASDPALAVSGTRLCMDRYRRLRGKER